jgi:hypothetical protein
MADNTVSPRGYGQWRFELYNPQKEIGPFEGILEVSKDFHTVFTVRESGERDYLLNVSSHNVSYVENMKSKKG